MRAINIVDIGILAVIGLCVLYGLYQGFLGSMLRTGASLLSLGCGFWFYPRLAGLIQSSPTLQRTLLTYTDATNRLGDLSLSLTSVHTLTEEQISRIVLKADLPASLSEILRYNLQNRIYTGISTVADYVSETILSAVINTLCFLICFAAAYIVFCLIISLIDSLFHFPQLKIFNTLTGGVFGLLRGILICSALFAVVPLAQTMIPVQLITSLIEESRLAGMFMGGGMITAIMNGHL